MVKSLTLNQTHVGSMPTRCTKHINNGVIFMAKTDRNGVRHDGWAAVGEANRNRQGHGGRADSSYENLARSQGVDLNRTQYRKVGGR